ncbi:HRDC domain protein [Thermoplasmatales archaeon BRNA1]|nr:HRDC domain protein [Thermoplasmatales archaeon BRNA1]
MSLEEELKNELYCLRDDLRHKNRKQNGKEPMICSDEALTQMSQHIPVKEADLSAIDGIGDRFIENYGRDFLAVTRKYAVSAAKGSDINKSMDQTLRELQKKLVNISKGNRLLYMPRTSVKNSFDIMDGRDTDVESFLFGRKRSLKLCGASSSKEEEKKFRRLNNILREVTRDQRERGMYDLYIGYPFIEGSLAGEEDFPLRGPLALFPVTMSKNGREISIELDDSRDTVYNNTLILASIKMMKTHKTLPDCVLDDWSQDSFLRDLVAFYANEGISMEIPDGRVVRFREYKATEFPKYKPGEFRMTLNAVLGKYPSYSSFIQRDFDTLLSGKEINNTLNDLLKDLNKEDFYSEYPLPLSQSEIRNKGIEASERNLTYINTLNSAQENVLTAVDKEDEIVVQGPPGTGKSQVITGLICSAVAEGKTVLMVSEKKTALDVVYSRMGTLSKYALQIDDTADKDRFYKQLGNMLRTEPRAPAPGIGQLSEAIDTDVAKLSDIANTLYEPDEFGLKPNDLYARDRWLDLNDRGQFETFQLYKAGVSPSLLTIDYDELSDLHIKYSDPGLINNFREYNDILDKSPWMEKMKTGLTNYQISEMKADLERVHAMNEDLSRKGFLSRLFAKGKVDRDTTEIVDKYFDRYGPKDIDYVKSNASSISDSIDDYDRFSRRATLYRALDSTQREYWKNLTALTRNVKTSYSNANDNMFEYIMNDHLQKFDATHSELMQELHDFDSIVADMDRRMEEKRQVTRRLLESELSNSLRYITESKRRGDIARIVENKRKWSLNKFINRYGYELFKGVRIWLLTPEVVSEIIPMEMGLFDLLVFDEASQMYVERGIPSIYRAKKVVVAGDHKQLRPSSLGVGRVTYDEEDEEDLDVNSALEEESLLDLARSRYDSILLNFHYRSKYEELIAFSNYAFYGGRLYVSPNIASPARPPIEMIKVDGKWEDRSNSAEADRVVELLKQIFRERQHDETIGIITFNSSQRDLINDRIDDACSDDPAFSNLIASEEKRMDNGEDVGLFVKNIESVQGDERDIIIFSIGYAKNEEGRIMQRFGWLNTHGGENRLNVAISRAKKKIYIVNSFDPEELQVDTVKGDGPKILKKYLQYARAVSDGNEEYARTILKSFVSPGDDEANPSVDVYPVMDRVYDALIRKGYTVERNVGIGGYNIDLAVKQNDKFILGIECDSRIYALSASTRERDYHRQKYLESRGWHIHRVWTAGMYKDPAEEIAKIVAAIEKSQTTA